MRRLTLTAFCLGILCALTSAPSAFSDDAKLLELTARLCRGGGGDWTRAVAATVSNQTNSDSIERTTSVPIAGSKGSPVANALPFVGEQAQSVRVCDAQGTEYLFNILQSNGSFVDKGAIPEGCVLTFPATVPAGSETTYYFFAGNPKAYPNPDRLDKTLNIPTNLDFETGAGNSVDGWNFSATDAAHKLSWVDESPYSGEKCVRCDVADGAEPSWVAACQTRVAITPGARYRFSGYLRGEDVDGNSGWYLHLGNDENPMLSSPMLWAPKASNFGWTRVEHEFTAPENVTRLDYGTVLYGTGRCWYDLASLERLDSSTTQELFHVQVGDEIEIPTPPTVGTLDDAFSLNSPIPAAARVVALRVEPPTSSGERLIAFNLEAIATRWSRALSVDDIVVLDHSGRPVKVELLGNQAFFLAETTAGARNLFTLYEKTSAVAGKKSAAVGQNVANQAFPGTMLQSTNAEQADETAAATSDVSELALPEFFRDLNLLKDGDFEGELDAWSHDANGLGYRYEFFDSGIPALGSRSLRVTTTSESDRSWRGWRRTVKVVPGQTYLIGYASSCEAKSGSYDLHLHWRKEKGELVDGGMSSIGQPIAGTTGWALRSSISKAAYDAATVTLHLTSDSYGVVSYDSVFVLPVDEATPVEFTGGKSGVFQVSAVAKVFNDTTFGASTPSLEVARGASAQPSFDAQIATCALARDEEETLQLAIRLDDKLGPTLRVNVDAPAPKRRGSDDLLDAPDVFAIGNVIVDYPTSYYQSRTSATTRKFPTARHTCDGWIGLWPDPMIPIETKNANTADALAKRAGALASFGAPELWNDSQRLTVDGFVGATTLRSGETRALWLRFKTTSQTPVGVYEGVLTLAFDDGRDALKIPYTVEVLDFTAPETKITGIYDARVHRDYFGDGSYTDKLRRVEAKLVDRKLASDKPVAPLKIDYDKESGVASADWTEFDAALTTYFDELGCKAAYFDNSFYLFGWGLPPKVIEGEAPYHGEWPYDGEDRSQLRPEYKRAYQAKLKLYWDHLKEKGWADKCVLYISDEPFYSKPEILAQMKALCDMIHEVDPAIPIYSSTWVFVPEWLGYLDVWGVGHYGGVSAEDLGRIHDAGSRIWWTTDGQMCLDTPLCAVERLLPYACVARNAEIYEFWGASWYTCNPFDTASHLYIPQSDQPGVHYYVRYPNGDGYIFYPGELIGRAGEMIDSIRSEQAREGIEDAGWLVGLQEAIQQTSEPDLRAEGQAALDRALNYLPLECGSGRYSSRYISDPDEFERIRLDVGRALEKLTRAR